MKKTLLLITLLVAFFQTQAQRTLPYPIILVHGLGGSNATWGTFKNYLSNQAKLSVSESNLSFDLNCDNNIYKSNLYSDVCNYTIGNLGDHDVYIVDFAIGFNNLPNNALSNQSAIVKQGYALKLAIQEALRATKAEKVVLLGHSMGGLAIREYLQNTSNWQNDAQHHVAKLITIGTPHGGSNLGSGDINISDFSPSFVYNQESEAVRDLRTSYKTGYQGVYLSGGFENTTYIQRGFGLVSNYFNLDVNCNGREGDFIVGLNRKGLYSDLDFACIIGGPDFSDGVVTVSSQNLNTFYPTLGAELFFHSCNLTLYCHTNEPKEAIFPMVYALDEPKKYPIEIQHNKLYKGFFTNQSNGSYIDTDTYTVYCSAKGILKINCNAPASVGGRITLRNYAGAQIADFAIGSGINQEIEIPYSGAYSIIFTGNSNNGWATYNYSTNFCPMPENLTITPAGKTTFCDGQSVTLSSTNGYNQYQWYKDGKQINGNNNPLIANQSGVFSVQAQICERWVNSANTITVTVKSIPEKPSITKEDQPNQFLLTASNSQNYQWMLNGSPIKEANTQAYVPQELGNYTVKVANGECENQSDAVRVQVEKPKLTLNGSNPICEGESTTLVTSTGFGKYKWLKDQIETLNDKNDLAVNISGSYRVATQRGEFISEYSDPIAITVNPKPSKPTVSLEGYSLKSSSTTHNQWYSNGTALKDSTGQIIHNIGGGSYVVRVTELGCYSESEPFVITASMSTSILSPIKVYPNPNKGLFWVEFPDYINIEQVEVYDSQGKRILEKQQASQSNREQIELKPIPGTYFIKIRTGSLQQTIKFEIQ